MKAKLIPILIDCSLKDLARPLKGYQQLQDICVPMLTERRPISVDSAAVLGDSNAEEDLIEAVLRRLGFS